MLGMKLNRFKLSFRAKIEIKYKSLWLYCNACIFMDNSLCYYVPMVQKGGGGGSFYHEIDTITPSPFLTIVYFHLLFLKKANQKVITTFLCFVMAEKKILY